MLTNIILAGLIPGTIAGPIMWRHNADAAGDAAENLDRRQYTYRAGYPVHAMPHAPTGVYPTSGYSLPPAGPTAYGSAPVSTPSGYSSSFPVESSPTYSSVTPSLPVESPHTQTPSTHSPTTHSYSTPSVTTVRVVDPTYTTLASDPVYTIPAADNAYAISASAVHPAAAAAAAPSVRPVAHDHPITEESSSPALAADGSEDMACAEDCEVKCQVAHIAIDVTQCRTSCVSACARSKTSAAHGTSGHALANNAIAAAAGESCGHGHGVPGADVLVKKDLFPNGPFESSKKPTVKLNDGFVSYEACMKSCGGKFQSALGDFSQGEYHCKTECAQYAEDGTDVQIKKDLFPNGPFESSKKPKVKVDDGFVSYAACIKSCESKSQNALHIASTGEYDCETTCAQYAEKGTNVIIKKDLFPNGPFESSKKPKVKVSDGFVSYEACMKSCGGKFQSALGDFSQGEYHCKTECAQYAKKGPDVVIKKDFLEGGPFGDTSSGVELADGFINYAACMKQCNADIQSALHNSQGEKDCETTCAEYTEEGTNILVKKGTYTDLFEDSKKPTLKFDDGTSAYQTCMEKCGGKWQNAHIAVDVTTGENHCKTSCAQYAQEGVDMVIKRDGRTPPHYGDGPYMWFDRKQGEQ